MNKEGTTVTPTIFNEKVAAAYLGMSVGYLRQSRMKANQLGYEGGPPFIKIGRSVRYRLEDLEEYLQSRRVAYSKQHIGAD